MSYSLATSLSCYDMLTDDSFNMNYTNQVDSKPELDLELSYCFPPAGELAFAYPTHDGPPSLPTFSSPSSTSSSSVASCVTDDTSSQPIIESETEEREARPAAKQLRKRKRRSDSVGRVGDQPKKRAAQRGAGSSKTFVRPP
jgi:hypothetical protein